MNCQVRFLPLSLAAFLAKATVESWVRAATEVFSSLVFTYFILLLGCLGFFFKQVWHINIIVEKQLIWLPQKPTESLLS